MMLKQSFLEPTVLQSTEPLCGAASEGKMKKLQVAYNEAFTILLKLPRWISTSDMFVTVNVLTFHAVFRNSSYNFT